MVDRGDDPFVISRKGMLGGSEGAYWRVQRPHSPNISEIARKLVKDDYAAIELVTVYSVTFFISDSILLLLVVRQIFKTPLHSNGKCLGSYLLGSN